MIPLERRCRLLLRAYPAAYRADRDEELLDTLLDATPAGRTWPLARDIWALLLAGLRVRGGQNRRLSTGGNLRLAALLGCAIYLAYIACSYLANGWYAVALLSWSPNAALFARSWGWDVVPGALILVAVVLAWLASRRVAAFGAVIAGTAVVAHGFWSAPAPPVAPIRLVLVPLLGLLPLAALVLLSRGAQRPPRCWLGLPGLVMAQPVAALLAVHIHWYQGFSLIFPQYHLWLVMFAAAVGWIGVDARPAIGMVISLALCSAYLLICYARAVGQWWLWGIIWPLEWTWLAAVLGLAVLALWRVRRQALL